MNTDVIAKNKTQTNKPETNDVKNLSWYTHRFVYLLNWGASTIFLHG